MKNKKSEINTSIGALYCNEDQVLIMHIGKNSLDILTSISEYFSTNYSLSISPIKVIEKENCPLDLENIPINSLFSHPKKIQLIVLSFEIEDDYVLEIAKKIIRSLKKRALCIVGVCIDIDHIEKDPYGKVIPTNKAPIEIANSDLLTILDALVISQLDYFKKGTSTTEIFCEIAYMLIDIYFQTKDPDTRSDLLSRIKNSGFAYYSSKKSVQWNIQIAINQFLFESLFVCPFYVAEQVLFSYSYGAGFEIAEGLNLGDDEIILTYMEDHMDSEAVLTSFPILNPKLSDYEIEFRSLFLGFGDKTSIFNEHYVAQYPKSDDKRLNNRINRMLQSPFYLKRKYENYQEYLERIKTTDENH